MNRYGAVDREHKLIQNILVEIMGPSNSKKRGKLIRRKASKGTVTKRRPLRSADQSGWNELVLPENRLKSCNKNARRPAGAKPTHLVIHVTGTTDLESVKRTFLAPNSVSTHYLVTPLGELFQFVRDNERAYHAGIDSNTRKLYRKGYDAWSHYLKFFNWYKEYPEDAVYLDGDGNPVWDKSEAVFVAKSDGTVWNDFSYFRRRWPDFDTPVNFDIDPDPNNYSIGIECLSIGSKTKDESVYTEEMYKTLRLLIKNLSGKYGIPRKKGLLVGHEDVNPIGRFGWDPNSGFDWTLIHN